MRVRITLQSVVSTVLLSEIGGATGSRTPICSLQSCRITVIQIAPLTRCWLWRFTPTQGLSPLDFCCSMHLKISGDKVDQCLIVPLAACHSTRMSTHYEVVLLIRDLPRLFGWLFVKQTGNRRIFILCIPEWLAANWLRCPDSHTALHLMKVKCTSYTLPQ